ncbi:MarR family winged helix-turn-helix transcriptional regulator [Patulibacter defluvii]|uniref:MarR family winged helix-turn-helix transcriptional regulator n=1 Tax=Patulibacter defluvii TaxID=3095358 RepID=UPI002A753F2D|nr:MarR family transcriptional regulator [Patulibacter sp. DM4]
MIAPPSPSRDVTALAATLPARTARTTRLLLRRADSDLSRSSAGVLAALAEGPLRITELADWEGLAQPTVTLLVAQMERDGLVRRDRDPADRRAVLVSITDAGRAARQQLHQALAALLRERTAHLDDDQFAALAAASDALALLIDALQKGSA